MDKSDWRLLGAVAAGFPLGVAIWAAVARPAPAPIAAAIKPASSHIVNSYGQLPIRFEPNVGQATATVKFIARDAGYRVALTDNQVLLNLRHTAAHRPDKAPPLQLRVSLSGGNPHPAMVAEQRQTSQSNYLVGKDPAQWHSQVANYAAVRYRQIYPGIDWLVYGNPRQLEYDLAVAAGADPRQIRLRIDGADQLAIDDNGDLLVRTEGETLRQLKPVIYQLSANGERQAVGGRYAIDRQEVAFELASYDASRPLIIDPVLSYSTYLGGSGSDQANAIAVDGSGNAYVAGFSFSTDFPTADPAQPLNNSEVSGLSNAFISKLSADGSTLLYSTYLGGTSSLGPDGFGQGDFASAIAVDGDGNAYITGYTTSIDFPTVNPFQSTNLSSVGTAFVAKLNAAGSALVYSTYLGGSGNPFGSLFGDSGNAIAIDRAGNAYVGGSAESIDFPIINAFQASNREFNKNFGEAGPTAFVTKLNAAGNALVYSTYLGGTGQAGFSQLEGDSISAITVDDAGSAYVTGRTSSLNFPLAHPFQNKNLAAYTAFVTKFNPAGSALEYSTYLGGSTGDEIANAIAVDSGGSAYVAGETSSTDFPTANPLQASNDAIQYSATAFVSKFSSDGKSLVYSTYLGGSQSEQANAIAVDAQGDAFVAGATESSDFPTASPLQAANHSLDDSYNGFVTEFNPAGSALLFSSYLGGSGNNGDFANAIAVDSTGNAYVAGSTDSTDFPTVNPFQATNLAKSGSSNAFVAKISAAGTAPVNPPVSGSASGGGAMGLEVMGGLGMLLAMRRRRRIGACQGLPLLNANVESARPRKIRTPCSTRS